MSLGRAVSRVFLDREAMQGLLKSAAEELSEEEEDARRRRLNMLLIALGGLGAAGGLGYLAWQSANEKKDPLPSENKAPPLAAVIETGQDVAAGLPYSREIRTVARDVTRKLTGDPEAESPIQPMDIAGMTLGGVRALTATPWWRRLNPFSRSGGGPAKHLEKGLPTVHTVIDSIIHPGSTTPGASGSPQTSPSLWRRPLGWLGFESGREIYQKQLSKMQVPVNKFLTTHGMNNTPQMSALLSDQLAKAGKGESSAFDVYLGPGSSSPTTPHTPNKGVLFQRARDSQRVNQLVDNIQRDTQIIEQPGGRGIGTDAERRLKSVATKLNLPIYEDLLQLPDNAFIANRNPYKASPQSTQGQNNESPVLNVGTEITAADGRRLIHNPAQAAKNKYQAVTDLGSTVKSVSKIPSRVGTFASVAKRFAAPALLFSVGSRLVPWLERTVYGGPETRVRSDLPQ